MAEELWQLYDEQGRPIVGGGAKKDDVFKNALLHGASHVWIWRENKGVREILLQKCSATKRIWPNCYDISAAGHIVLGEDPLAAAVRETIEEIGLNVSITDLKLISVHRAFITAQDGSIENEFQWLYLFELPADEDTFELQLSEVDSLEWKPLLEFGMDVLGDTNNYVPHGDAYYGTVCSADDAA